MVWVKKDLSVKLYVNAGDNRVCIFETTGFRSKGLRYRNDRLMDKWPFVLMGQFSDYWGFGIMGCGKNAMALVLVCVGYFDNQIFFFLMW